MKIDVTTVHGAKAGSVDLPDEMFGITPEMMYLPTFELCDAEVCKGIKHIRQVEASLAS